MLKVMLNISGSGFQWSVDRKGGAYLQTFKGRAVAVSVTLTEPYKAVFATDEVDYSSKFLADISSQTTTIWMQTCKVDKL